MRVLLLLACIVTLTSCSDLGFNSLGFGQDDDAAATATPRYTQLAPSAPPPRPFEARPPVPEGQPRLYIWRPGHWHFDGLNFSWVAGRYMPKPNFTATWSPDRWERRAYGWAFVPGHWR